MYLKEADTLQRIWSPDATVVAIGKGLDGILQQRGGLLVLKSSSKLEFALYTYAFSRGPFPLLRSLSVSYYHPPYCHLMKHLQCMECQTCERAETKSPLP
jgi:hypothetical protein